MNVIKKKRAVFLATLALLTVNLSVMALFMSRGFGLSWSTWGVMALASVVTLLLHLTNPDSERVSSATQYGFWCWLVIAGIYIFDAVSGNHSLTHSPGFLFFALSVSVMVTFAFTVMAALYLSLIHI